MFEKAKACLNNKNSVNYFLFLCNCITIFCYMFYQNHIFILIFYISTFIYVIINYEQLFALVTKFWKAIISFSVILFFFSRIYAEKALSLKYDIQPEYLNYSITIYAVLLAIVFGGILIFSFYFLLYIIKSSCLDFIPFPFFNTKYREKKSHIMSHFMLFILSGLFIVIIHLSYINDVLRDYYIIADAYPISDCGQKNKDIVYIRKNSAECYSITLTIPPVFKTVRVEK